MTLVSLDPALPPRSLVLRLLAAVLVINTFVVALSGLLLYQSRLQHVNRVTIQTQNLVTALELTLSGLFNKTSLTLLTIIDEAEKQLEDGVIDWNSLSKFASRQHSRIPEVDSLRIIQANGDMISFDGNKKNIIMNVASLDYFIKHKNDSNARLVFSKPLLSRVTNKWLFTVSQRFNNPDGSFAGIILASISIDSLMQMFSTFDLGKDGVITLRDADLDVIARHPATMGKRSTIGSKAVSRELKDRVERGEIAGTYISPGSIDSMRRIFSYRKLSQYPLYVNAGRSSRDYLDAWYGEVWKTAAMCLLFALGTLFSARLMFLKWKQKQLSEIALKHYNEQLETQVIERTSELSSVNEQLQRELTEREKIEKELELQKRHLRAIIETEPDCVKLLDRDGRLLMMNPAGLAMIQAETFEEVEGAYAYNLAVPEHRQAFIKATNDAFEGRSGTVTFKVTGLKGGSLWLESHVAPLRNEQGEIVSMIGITRDITERKQTAEALQMTRLSIEHASDSLFWLTSDACIVDVNEAACRSLGYSREELLQLTVQDVDVNYNSSMWTQHFADLRKRGSLKVESEQITKDGRLIPVEIVANYVKVDDKELNCAFVRDITDRKQTEAENNILGAQLQQAQKMESVGRLAGGVAHDFNNLLTVILGRSEMALMKLDRSHPLFESLTEINGAAMRSADLTRQLLAFARKQTIAPKILDLNDTVSGMLKMLQRLIGEDVQLAWQPMANLWQVKMDSSQIDQILANLCVNAKDAIEDIGRITIETGNRIIDEFYCAVNAGFVPGEYVFLSVNDDGCGMDKETLAHIFEPFFTTKDIGAGTGLGLATVYGIVKQNNGFINVYSEPGRGTTFTIYLPRHRRETGPLPAESVAELSPRGQGTILLVEDEPSILNMTASMLEGQGYTVLPANTPDAAINLAREHAGKILLLMTDVIMPGMNGLNLAQNLRNIYPDIRCLFMSGYTADVIAHHGVLDEGVHFIQKPFSLLEISTKVREVLTYSM